MVSGAFFLFLGAALLIPYYDSAPTPAKAKVESPSTPPNPSVDATAPLTPSEGHVESRISRRPAHADHRLEATVRKPEGVPKEPEASALPAPTEPASTPASPVASKATQEASPLAGKWVFTPDPMDRQDPKSFPAEYVELTILAADGRLRGTYRSRYKVPDHSLSPYANFMFEGASSATCFDWRGEGGAGGQVTLGLESHDRLQVSWFATKMGTELFARFRIGHGFPISMKTFFRLLAVTCLLLGSGQALRIGVADSLFRRDTTESVKRAVRLWPSNAEFDARLADLDPDNTIVHLRRAVFLNPSLSRSWISLGLQLEFQGNPEEAEQCYLKAAQRDRQFLPAWTLANFYFRRNDRERFWPWARNAGQMSYGDLRPLFRLAFEMSDSVETVFGKMIVPRRTVEHQFLQELLDRNLDASLVADRMMSHASREDLPPLLALVNRLIETRRIPQARRLWNALSARTLIPYPRSALITNADFSHDPLPEGGFDWRITLPAGVDLERIAEGLRLEFSGRQPEKFELLWQALDAPPGMYRLSFEYRTVDIRGATNLRWRIGGVSLPPLAPVENWTRASHTFAAAFSNGSANKLQLLEERDPGTMRPEGVVYLRDLVLTRYD